MLRRACAAGSALLLAVVLAARAQDAVPPDEQRLRALERRAADRLAALQRDADALAGRQRGLLDQLRVLELRRDIAVAESERASAALAAAEAELGRIDARRTAVQRAMDARRPHVQARLAALYRSGAAGDLRRWLMAETMVEAAAAERLLAAVAARDRSEFAAFAALRDELAARDEALRRQRQTLAERRAAADAARQSAARAAAAHAALMGELDRRRDLAAQLAGELETARLALQRQIEGLATGPGVAALPIAPFRGALPWPAAGRLVGGFGRRPSSRFGTAVSRNGIEIGATAGTPVRAVHEGRVAFAGEFAGLGRLVIVDHGRGAFSLYGYLDHLDVQRGVTVDRGGVIGRSGRSPAGEAAVYFELRIDARPVNPLEWLTR
ncbi:MAG: peptidoglycan DD-metalloendopeptidase family protein [Vicinamibacterales bacterium]|nr:peptidoglycan DD-metalloendopeptidase family protein [Vicinamibacterales bacterium]